MAGVLNSPKEVCGNSQRRHLGGGDLKSMEYEGLARSDRGSIIRGRPGPMCFVG